MDVLRYAKLSHFTPSAVPLLLAMYQFSTFYISVQQVQQSVSHYISLKWLIILCNDIPRLHGWYIQTYNRHNENTQSRVK